MSEEIAIKLRDFYVCSQALMEATMKRHGTSWSRTKLLLFISRADWVRSTDIIESFGHAPRTVTEAIDGLERDGLIRRDPDPNDRRAKRVSITPEGRTMLDQSEPSRQKFMADLFASLDSGETAALGHLLDKLNLRLKALAVEDTAAD